MKNLKRRLMMSLILYALRSSKMDILDTYFIINGLDKRFTNIADAHEMYCLGHFLEAACAYYHATGKDKLLNALIKYVNLIDQTFGEEEGKLKGYPGHEVLEMALMKLYEITKDPKHLKLAAYFINQRGQSPNYLLRKRRSIRISITGRNPCSSTDIIRHISQ